MVHTTDIAELKQLGNAAHQAGDFRQALFFFSLALSVNKDPAHAHVLYSNRSASYCLLEDFPRALSDAEAVIALRPDWAKGYSRKGLALLNLKRYAEAAEAYRQGLALEPTSELMKKGLQDVLVAQKHHEVRQYDPTAPVDAKTRNALQAVRPLPQLPNVRWHVEVLHDRIWLADPPYAPFRPRSMFVFDAGRLQMLGMAPHANCRPITADELLDFLAKTCLNHNIRPAALEVSDPRLRDLLEEEVAALDVEVLLGAMTAEKQRLLKDTVAAFDARESEQWEQNKKFAGVLKQRRQRGLMAVPDVTPGFVKNLVEAAHEFYHQRVHLYIPMPVGIRLGAGELLVVRVRQTDRGACCLEVAAADAEEAGGAPPPCLHSLAFHDLSNVPFEDADDFERLGVLDGEGKYPFPVVGREDADAVIQRPGFETLAWWEAALRALVVAVGNTSAKPGWTLPDDAAEIVQSCTVAAHRGPVVVTVSCPPSPSLTPNYPASSTATPNGATHTITADRPIPRPPPEAPSKLPAYPPPPRQPPAAALPAAGPEVRPAEEVEDRWRQEQAALGMYRQVWRTEQIQREALLTHLSDLLLKPQTSPPDVAAGDSKEMVEDLRGQLDHLRSKCEFQAQQIKCQNDLIQQLQARVSHLEGTEKHLRSEVEALCRHDAKEGRMIMNDLTAGLQGTIRALSLTQEEFKRWIEVIVSDTTLQRQRHLERLGKGKHETFAALETSLAAAKQQLLSSDFGAKGSPSGSLLLPNPNGSPWGTP